MLTRSSARFNGQRPADGFKPRLRRRLAIVIAGALFVLYALSATYIVVGVLRARSNEIDRLSTASASLSQALDREVARSFALLAGLEYSPALQRHDIEAFQRQMAATRVPRGAWLILCDREKLVAHSLRPFGAPLPTLADFTPQPEFLERIDRLDVSLTGRVRSLVLNQMAVTVNMKVHDPGGGWTYFLTTVLSDQRLASILKEQQMAPGLTGAIYDHGLNGVVSVRGDEVTVAPVMDRAASSVLGARPAPAGSGMIRAAGSQGEPSLIAYTQSAYTQWIATASMTRADLDAPVRDALELLVGAGLLMGLAGFGAWRHLRREIESPIEQLQRSIASADAQVEHLAGRLLQAQEDEHQRIARELHDSTAQHLVGAMLGVANLERMGPGNDNDGARSMLKDVKASVESALNELRTFTLLLHPRDLGGQGLARALTDFAQGFIRRSGLQGTVAVDTAADSLPFELQRSLLRITQGALANVYRHARATRVAIRLEMDARQIVLSIEDDGLGSRQAVPGEPGQGVGIPSMQGRLIPFGGELRIESTAHGTVVRAIVPLPLPA